MLKVTFENDELREKLSFIERKYNSLISKLGASQEDIEAIE